MGKFNASGGSQRERDLPVFAQLSRNSTNPLIAAKATLDALPRPPHGLSCPMKPIFWVVSLEGTTQSLVCRDSCYKGGDLPGNLSDTGIMSHSQDMGYLRLSTMW